MEIAVTLIVPAYNPPKGHFEECCLSISRQETKYPFEVIVVDDCSDRVSSSEIAEACGRFGFGLLRNEENLGVSRSRNRAMSCARGDFIAFLDADDCIYPDFIDDVMKLAEKSGADCVAGEVLLTPPDIFLPEREVVTQCPRVFKGGDVTLVMEGIIAGNDFMPKAVAEAKSFVHAGPVARLYRRDVIVSHGLGFDPELTCGEDIKFNLDFLVWADACAISDMVWYQYKQHMTSATNGVESAQLEGQVRFCEDLLVNPIVVRFGMEQAAYGRILGGLKTLVRRICASGYPTKGEVRGEIARLMGLRVFRTACDSIDLSQFRLASKDKVFAWLSRKRFSTAAYLLSMLALADRREGHP